jgi:hypothetical protein
MTNKHISKYFEKYLCSHVAPYIEAAFDENGNHYLIKTLKLTDSWVQECFNNVGDLEHATDLFGKKICLSNQPERSKRENSQCEMRCSEHCGNTMREVQ